MEGNSTLNCERWFQSSPPDLSAFVDRWLALEDRPEGRAAEAEVIVEVDICENAVTSEGRTVTEPDTVDGSLRISLGVSLSEAILSRSTDRDGERRCSLGGAGDDRLDERLRGIGVPSEWVRTSSAGWAVVGTPSGAVCM